MNERCFTNGKIVLAEEPQALFDSQDQENADPNRSTSERLDKIKSEKMAIDEDNAAAELESLVNRQRFLVLSLPNCPQCDELGTLLAARGVPSSVFVKWNKSDPKYPKLKAALAKHAGDVFTFPQVFVEGKYEGCFEKAAEKIEAGVFDCIFEDEFDVVPTTVSRCVERRPMLVISLPNCPQCDVLRDHLAQRGLPVGEIFTKWDKSKREYPVLKAQLIRLIGQSSFTFPQTFIDGEYQGNYDEVIAKADAKQYDDAFERHFGIKPIAPVVQDISSAIAFDDDF